MQEMERERGRGARQKRKGGFMRRKVAAMRKTREGMEGE